MKIFKYIILAFILFFYCEVFAQTDRDYIRIGNRFFHEQNYAKSEIEYRKAIAFNASNSQALYNLGCALMMQQKDSAAIVQYMNAGKIEQNKIRKAKAFHNIGAICQRHQMYGDAIQVYQESLRNNPNDNETRYNLALCKRLQKQQNQNKENNNQNKNNKEQNDKDNKNQQQDKKQQQNQQKQLQNQMSKDNAEQLLNAAMQEEKATQQRMKQMGHKPQNRQLQKNW